ncbi:hypothetical protein CWE09_05935 [Aliidiomarina minuta]|uniref:Capsule assembly Wzi family protein n=1 Tax=Aliidiomarina minuta TaxID=880057 RepID=A0A432W816_9GAMM|nr:capsule assembly Wzi family protein [Aliidiomarina minuta]RUO26253.1 hypothetical protein CWE09_05935 [Aliidiomarina minuta]
MKRFSSIALGALLASGITSVAVAAPWAEADDIYLRISIQQLADAGYLRGTVNTYPLMWSGIARDLREINPGWLDDSELFAYYRVRAALQFAQQSQVSRVRLSANSDEERLQSFGDSYHEKGAFTASRSFQWEHSAARIQTSFRSGSSDDKSYIFDGSYLATTLGNWALSADQMPVWWGPGQDSALVLSTNARPVQALRINRLRDDASSLPLLSLAGNWHATAFVGRTQRAGELGDIQMGGVRLSIRPARFIELGASYTAQWGGSSHPQNLTLDDNTGNQMGGVDVRFSLSSNLGVYSELASSESELDDLALLVGADFSFSSPQRLQQVFTEYSDTPAAFYDDERDPAGYRRWQQSIGSTHDQHVQSLVVGYRNHAATGEGWQTRLLFAEYGDTNLYMANEYSLNPGENIERLQFDIKYQRPFGDTLFGLGVELYSDELIAPTLGERKKRENGFNLMTSWEFRF